MLNGNDNVEGAGHENSTKNIPSISSASNTAHDSALDPIRNSKPEELKAQRIDLSEHSPEEDFAKNLANEIIQSLGNSLNEGLVLSTVEQHIREYTGPLPHHEDMAGYDSETRAVILSEFAKDGESRRRDNELDSQRRRVNSTLDLVLSTIVVLVLSGGAIYLFMLGNTSGGILATLTIFALTFLTWLFSEGKYYVSALVRKLTGKKK
ncbi:MAG: hypothetical protein FWE48_07880 [Coriobacteriia bacterium]|nr:hypothetical protein [Coriobacteriia bacterium]